VIRPLAAAALVAALAAPAAPAAAAPSTTVVDLGGARGYVRPDAGLPLAGLTLWVRAGLDRQAGSQNGLAALVAESVLLTPVDGRPLADAVEAQGASLSIAVAPQQVRFFFEGTPEALTAAAPLVARALAAPAFDPAGLAAARAALGERIAANQDDPALVGLEMLRSSYYRDGAGFPALGNPGSLAAFAPADARAFFARWYVRGNAFVTAVGKTGPPTDAASRALVAALAPGSAPADTIAARPFGSAPKRIVTQRDVGAPVVVLGFAAPAFGERDFPAALVMLSLLGAVFERAGATTTPPAFRPVGTFYGYDAAPAHLALWLNGALVQPASGLAALDVLVKGAAAKPLGAAVLARYKEKARGEWALERLTLDDRAVAIGNAVARGLDADAAGQVGAAIAQVSAADVQRVAKKYFQKFDVALIVPRGGGT
jgi:zinc protease